MLLQPAVMRCQISRTAGTVTYRRSELTGLTLLPFLYHSNFLCDILSL
uniref:Uncharacterized protein n=1 Tax=Siphoviridae sp. ctkyp1 TaxID=2825646 RepID=A0A8S5P4S4_9CAUD|nr:MAG TPA: hypothetical protein [Siphoviridae sp. ctkyp1]DAH50199.1 MAG TPA: hypothetical protein [Caudoviricetes sp.]